MNFHSFGLKIKQNTSHTPYFKFIYLDYGKTHIYLTEAHRKNSEACFREIEEARKPIILEETLRRQRGREEQAKTYIV